MTVTFAPSFLLIAAVLSELLASTTMISSAQDTELMQSEITFSSFLVMMMTETGALVGVVECISLFIF